jgi:hypothetical protein
MSDYADLCESMGQDPSDPDAIDNMIDMCHGDAIDDDDDDWDDEDLDDDEEDDDDDDELIQTDEELEDEASFNE